MSATPDTVLLMSVEIRTEQDIVACRQQARQFASVFGFDVQSQTRIATAVSEIARNAYQYAGGGRAEFRAETEADSSRGQHPRQQSLVISVLDQGPGIPQLEAILGGSYRSPTGMGMGIIGVHRLMDVVDIQTGPQGSTITIRKHLPPAARRRTKAELQELVVADSASPAPANVIDEVQRQNQELLSVMDEVSQRQEDLTRMNKELEETNAGVLALYDELETLHRVGLLLASKIDLPAVILTLIEVTTDLTGAEFGACYLRPDSKADWIRYAEAGPLRDILTGLPKVHSKDFFGENFGAEGLSHYPDLEGQAGPCSVSQFAASLLPGVKLRSCLAVPLTDSDQTVVGALVFGSSQANLFSERSERVVNSIAAQAIVAIDKARLYESVKAASEAKDTFLAMISHELRTPLNPVLSLVSSLYNDSSLPAPVREDLSVILRNVQLEVRLIDDLLDFHRIIKGNLNFSVEKVDMHAMIQNVVDICQPDVDARQHRLTLHLEADRCSIVGDPARLQQILWNILKNAIKFTNPGGFIDIYTRVEEGGTLAVAVQDNGRGIDPSMLQTIFGAFEQGNVQGITQFGGLGLGLAIAKAFVEKHEGTVVAESLGTDQGATITVRLPLSTVAQPPHSVVASSAQTAAPGSEIKGARILLIDDHADTLWSLSRLLSRHGYIVSTASDCAGGLAMVQAQSFDIIVSDLGLPDGSGLDLLRQIRNHSSVPAIALSGFGMEADIAGTQAVGFDSHLIKPVALSSLIAAIQNLLSRTGAGN